MKPFDQQNYYELLEVGDSASNDEIRAAYNRAIELFNPQSDAMYGLADANSVNGLRARLLEAMEILTEPDLRQEYNKSIGILSRPKNGAAEEPTQLAMTDLLAAASYTYSTRPHIQLSYIARLPAPPPQEPSNDGQRKPEAGNGYSPVASAAAAANGASPVASAVESKRMEATPEPSPSSESPETTSQPAEPSPSSESPEATSQPAAPKPRHLALAADISQEEAIATAEANMAQVAAKVREARPEPRAKPLEVAPDAEFNGELLRQCRENRGIGLQQLVEKTRISGRHLENIEADRYEELPATVYLRGFLVSIARELGLDPPRVSRSYLALVEARRAK